MSVSLLTGRVEVVNTLDQRSYGRRFEPRSDGLSSLILPNGGETDVKRLALALALAFFQL